MEPDARPPANFITAAEAARRAGVVRDYITRLCREGKLRGSVVGKNWHVDPESLNTFLIQSRRAKELRRARYAANFTAAQETEIAAPSELVLL